MNRGAAASLSVAALGLWWLSQRRSPVPSVTTSEMFALPGDGSTVDRIAEAIGQVESGGGYQIVGPATKSGDRPYGKYQILGANIAAWSRQALGYTLSPQAFLADPSAQDLIARTKIAQYFNSWPSVEDVAALWISGRPYAQAATLKDGTTGITVPAYVARVVRAFNA